MSTRITLSRHLTATLAGLGLALLLAAAPAHAGLFDAITDLTKKIADSKLNNDAAQDAAYEAELAKKFPPYQFDQPAAGQVERHVELTRGSNFKDIRKIAIVNFSIEFALFKEVQARGGQTSLSSTARDAEKSMQIPAPDVARLQTLVDQLYARTVQDFTAMGIEVLPFDKLKATKNYAELAPAQHASPWATDTKDSQSVFVAPSGMPLYMDNPERADFLKGLGMTFGTNTRLKEVMLTFELNREVHLLSVNMVVDFAAMKTSGRSFISYAAVGGANLHHLHAGNTSYRFIGPGQPELLYARLKQPLVSDIRLIAETQVALSQTSSQTLSAGGVATTTTSTGTTSGTRGAGAFDLDTYYRRSADLLGAAREMFALELSRQR
ncbi:MAG: hypothetical protein RL722_2505 [Pseudomonadota bacterium]|jgi:hypothetical protein